MPHHPGTRARSAPYTAPLLAFAVLLSLLLSLMLPTSAAWASAGRAAGPSVTGAECAPLPLAPFGDPGTSVGRTTVPAQGSGCFTFTAESPGVHHVLLDDPTNGAYTQVYDGDTALSCIDPNWRTSGWCDLPHAGPYTLQVVNSGWSQADVGAVVIPLAATTGCEEPTGTSWDEAPVLGSAPGLLSIQCHPFTGTAGERIVLDFKTVKYGDGQAWITDGTGARICPHFNEDDSEGCVLPGDGPYRVLTRVSSYEGGFPASYTLKVRRLSDPAGCARVPVNAYNSPPTSVDPATGCKVFSVPAAGRYDVYEVRDGSRSGLPVYDTTGRTVCESGNGCSLPAAGDYTVLTDNATLILDRASGAGCEAAVLGVHEGTFGTGGEIDCLTLPLPSGAMMAALKALSTPGPYPDVVVNDADGVRRCDWNTLSEGTCALTGRAPFRALVSTDDTDPATGPYRIALHRTDALSGCPAIPAGDFTDASPTARFSTGDGVFSQCLSIPADDHSGTENLQLRAVSGASTAEFSVLDANGTQVCSVYSSLSTWTTCDLTPGLAHTVLVTGRDTPATYTLTRRDVTSTAKGCAANPATAVGGPSTGGALGAPGTLICRQVSTTDAKDVLHLNVRDSLGTANILAYGADGEVACAYQNKACSATGSTRYQVLVTVPTTLEAAPDYHFDALRIATAAGPAAECAKVPNISYGYGPVTGTLTEQHSAICAVLPTKYSDHFSTLISDTKGGTETAVPALYDTSLGNGCTLSVPDGYLCSVSEPYSETVSPSILVLGLPEKVSETAFSAEFRCQSLCGPESVTVTGLTPATASSGTKATVTVTGSALRLEDKVRIYLSGKTIEATTTSVSADRRTLTAVLDLTGAPVGAWSVSVFTQGREFSRGTFAVTGPPLKNTVLPVITGSAKAGGQLSATAGTWTPAATSYSYRWKADGVAVSGATASTYTVPTTFAGKRITVTVTAHLTGFPDGSAVSAAVAVMAADAPKATVAPKITGTPKVGSTLTAAHGTWTPAPTSYGYQWFANGTAVPAATKATLTLTSAQAGMKITVKVIALLTGHSSGTATSPATAAVAR